LIVNCTGVGAKELVGDTEVYPIRGQVVKVKAPWVRHFLNSVDESSERLVYILPRSDCVILGGTAEKNQWDTTVDPKVTQTILDGAEKLSPGISKAHIIKQWVGLRPGRTRVRLEVEILPLFEAHQSVPVIHNYGHGGSGATLCWGCAKEVVQLAANWKQNDKSTSVVKNLSKL